MTTRCLTATLFLATAMAMAQSKPAPLQIDIKNLQGKTVGTATFKEARTGGIELDLKMTSMSPGNHLFHIHQKPVCDAAEEFNNAGLRFDPTGEFYGNAEHKHRTGPSAGDPQSGIEIGRDGAGHGTYLFPKLTLGDDDRSIVSHGGHAIVFHGVFGSQDPDRVACGIIAR